MAVDVAPEHLQASLIAFLSQYPDTAARVSAVKAALESPAGQLWREQLGEWTTWLVPVEDLVPEAYRHWRPLVRDSMQFVVSRLSADRLAPKVIEQIELPPDLPAELRLLHFISKVPGLQKIGQVLARNRHFDPRFRRALSNLENGISDAGIDEIRAIILRRLGRKMERFAVKLGSKILSEASVSAVVRFTWKNPRSGRRERGVFKVLKPHIPSCFAEDMRIIQRLAGFLARRYMEDRSRFAGLAETLTEIRLLLGHEVDFRREQRTLVAVQDTYGNLPGVRIPRLIAELSAPDITALTHEAGVKVTEAMRRVGARRRVAERLAETLLAVPALSRKDAQFHGDPHAGNLLYDKRRDEVVVLDWALTEYLTRDQRRFIALLVLMTMLRDVDGAHRAIERLRLHTASRDRQQSASVRARVTTFLRELPLWRATGPMDALNLLDEVAKDGIRFPAPLIMYRKAAFTLDGVVEDVAGSPVRLDAVLARYAAKHWRNTGLTLWWLLTPGDWISLELSALTFPVRVLAQPFSTALAREIEAPQAIAAAPISG